MKCERGFLVDVKSKRGNPLMTTLELCSPNPNDTLYIMKDEMQITTIYFTTFQKDHTAE